MQIHGTAAVLGLLLFSTEVLAKGNKNSTSTSVKAQCQEYAKLTKLTELAANETRLASKFDNNQTAIDAFKTKAADASQKLTTLSANATLVEACSVMEAHAAAVENCQKIQEMESRVSMAANQTKLEAKFDGNATKIAAFQAKASEAATKLTSLQSNQTLSQFCSQQKDIATCRSISSLQKEVALGSNQTALETKFKGNTTKIDDFKAKVAKMQTHLDSLTGNSTLMSTCTSLSQAGTIGAAAGSSSSGTAQTQKAGASGLAVSTTLLVTVMLGALLL